MSTDNRNTDLVHRFIRLPLEQRKLFLEKLASKGGSLAQLPIPQVRGDFEQLPLSYAQLRQWFLWKLDPASAVYNISSALRFKGSWTGQPCSEPSTACWPARCAAYHLPPTGRAGAAGGSPTPCVDGDL